MMIYFDTKTCMYPNCFEENVKSHAISRNISLESIAENYHLYSFIPKQNSRDTKKPSIELISTNKATRHHCFCDEHEEKFKRLDDHEISKTRDVLWQLYRTLCVAHNQEKTALVNLYKLNDPDSHKLISRGDVELFLTSSKFEKIIPMLDQASVLEAAQRKVKFQLSEFFDDELLKDEKLIERIKYIADTIDDKPIARNTLEVITNELLDHTIFYYKLDFQIPVALSAIQHGGFDGTRVKLHSTVVPYENSTVIIGLIPNLLLEDSKRTEKINNYFSSEYNIVKYVESLMSVSDGWFLKPSVIKNMSEEKNSTFETDCMFLNERSFFEDYDLSIFDDLKMNRFGLSDEDKEITFIPERADYSSRYEKMLEAMQIKVPQ
ncbi:hypothetical protein FG071_19190 [Vibrio cholerae]|nr:hypothetical protein [Vibrio cholerae]